MVWGGVLQGRKPTDQGTQIVALDGLRGAAVLFVFPSHIGDQGYFLVPHSDLSGVGKSRGGAASTSPSRTSVTPMRACARTMSRIDSTGFPSDTGTPPSRSHVTHTPRR
jgi:hypothetical protein